MTIIHVACAGVEHIGRVKGRSWKRAKKRQMLVLKDAVKVNYMQDNEGNVAMNLMDMKKSQRVPEGPIETKYEGTVYLQLSTQYPAYIWPLEMGGNLHQIYKNAISDSKIIKSVEPKIVTPGQQQRQRRGPPTPMGPRRN